VGVKRDITPRRTFASVAVVLEQEPVLDDWFIALSRFLSTPSLLPFCMIACIHESEKTWLTASKITLCHTPAIHKTYLANSE